MKARKKVRGSQIQDQPRALIFPKTRLEDVAGSLKSSRPPKALAEMHDAIDREVIRPPKSRPILTRAVFHPCESV